jgi:hypothetical protein
VTPAWAPERLAASPLFATLAPLLAACSGPPTLAWLNALAAAGDLKSGGGAPLRFVSPSLGTPYEAAVYSEGRVMTRPDSWHDLFNALAWLSFPQTKAALNRAHFTAYAAQRHGVARGPWRDRLTLFDESGLVMLTSDAELIALLYAHRWKAFFVERRADIARHVRFLVLGHALHEKALAPFKGITAKTLAVTVDPGVLGAPLAAQLACADAAGAQWVARPTVLAPLPILGIPGWWPDNEKRAYYDDSSHFRPLRRGVVGTAQAVPK